MSETEQATSSGFVGSVQPQFTQRAAAEPNQGSQLNHRSQFWDRSGLDKVGTEKLSRGLGWFSIGLGLAELLAPRAIARMCGGNGKHTGLIRFYGLREIAAGLMIFSGGRKPVMGMWSRVAGDAVDLATLGAAALSPTVSKAGVLFAATNVAAVTALDVLCARQLSVETGAMTAEGAICLKRTITINRSPHDVYAFWRDFQNFPGFMLHLLAVHQTGENRSHWVAKAPAGQRIEWDAEIVQDQPDELIAWRSDGGTVSHAGVVRFQPKPGGRGTIVKVELAYTPPGGMAGRVLAMLFNESPEQQIADDLRRLKQVLETGEVTRSDASPDGAGQVIQRPAQPTSGGN